MLSKISIMMIKFYQKASILKNPSCRFYPTCSNYSIEAINKYGLTKGGWLSAKRIMKCHPFHPGGYDQVP